MIIHNATFMMERAAEPQFISWLRSRLATLDMTSAEQPRISAMREAGGIDYRQAEAQSVAFQLEFHTMEAARLWSKKHFSTLAAEFEEKFGPEAMVFTSLFESISL